MPTIPDVSYWNGAISWDTAKACTDYVILRSSCGTAKDQNYTTNAKGCVANDIPYGAYHYLMANSASRAVLEADTMINSVKTVTKVLPTIWVIDVEQPDVIWANGKSLPMNPKLLSIVQAFAKRIRERMGDDISVWFYGGESVYTCGQLNKMAWDGYWLANYTKKPSMVCDLWQYTSTGKWNKKSPVDLSKLSGSMTIEKLARKTNYDISTEPPVKHEDDKEATKAQETVTSKPKYDVDLNGDGLIVRCVKPYAWNIRSGDGTEYESIAHAYQGYEWEYVATSTNGWICIRMNDGKLGWITPKAVQIIDLNKTK